MARSVTGGLLGHFLCHRDKLTMCAYVCVNAAYKQQRDCYGRTEITEAGLECFSDYNERLAEIIKRSESASTRAVAVSICRYAHTRRPDQ